MKNVNLLEKHCIKLNVKKNESYSSFMPCPDQYVGCVYYKDSLYKFCGDTENNDFKRLNLDYKFKKREDRCVIIVLESPHKDEFDQKSESKIPIGPANGATGRNIKCYVGDCLRKINCFNDSTKFDLLIMNTIQFQTSLGFPTKECRNKIFLSLWDEEIIREDFSRRLSCYIQIYSGGIIVNSGTIISSDKNCSNVKDEISKIIVNAIQFENRDFVVAESPHPSSLWYRKKQARILRRINSKN